MIAFQSRIHVPLDVGDLDVWLIGVHKDVLLQDDATEEQKIDGEKGQSDSEWSSNFKFYRRLLVVTTLRTANNLFVVLGNAIERIPKGGHQAEFDGCGKVDHIQYGEDSVDVQIFGANPHARRFVVLQQQSVPADKSFANKADAKQGEGIIQTGSDHHPAFCPEADVLPIKQSVTPQLIVSRDDEGERRI